MKDTLEIIDTRQKVLFIKELLRYGYKNKQISLIAKANPSYINKIKNGSLHKSTVLAAGETFAPTELQQKRWAAAQKILTTPEYITYADDGDADLMYIQVLKFFLVPKQDVRKLYIHYSNSYFSRLWATKGVDIRQFNSERIGLSRYDYLDLIIDYFLEWE